MNPTLHLYASSLLANWGFMDGEALDESPAYQAAIAGLRNPPRSHDVLVALVETHLLPAIPFPVDVTRFEFTMHNPIRIDKERYGAADLEELGKKLEAISVELSVDQVAAAVRSLPEQKPVATRRLHQRRKRTASNDPVIPQTQASLDFKDELIIDNFAGGGGTSTGLEAAFGRPVDIAINHDPEALAMHAINHPHTRHLCESVWDVDPIEVTGNQPVGLVWLSPDCKHFSKAKGGAPVEKKIRGLAWVGLRWAALTKPRMIMLENVEEFQDWGPLMLVERGGEEVWLPDPAKKGVTFNSFVRQLRGHGYKVEWRELRACDNDAPTIRNRLFLIARRDGLPIVWPEQTNGEPTNAAVIAGKLRPYRTAAECINFRLPAQSIFGRKKSLVKNTHRRVAKGVWRHVLTTEKPFFVDPNGDPQQQGEMLAPFVGDQSRPAELKTAGADQPLRTLCAQVKGGHFTLVAPTLAPMRGTSDGHMNGHDIASPLSTISAGGTHHGLVGANLVTIGYGERPGQDPRVHDIETPLLTITAGGVKQAISMAHMTKFRTGSVGQNLTEPMPTVTAGGTPRRPSTGIQMGLVAAHLVDMGHGEGACGTKRFSHGVRSLEVPLNTVTASGATSALAAVHLTHLTHHGERSGYSPSEPVRTVTGANRGEQALVSACLEQAYGGFYDSDGRSAGEPMSTITASGSQQRLITAYCVKYYSNGGQWQGLDEPMHTVPTKGRMGLVQTVKVPAASLSPEHRERARLCAELMHEHLPEHFSEPAEMVLVHQRGQWWVLVDITLRMLKPRELFNAQGFPRTYIIDEIPNPILLFKDGVQVADPLSLPRIPLTATAQVRMCGNSVSPKQAEALARANFRHEALIGRQSKRQPRLAVA